MAIEMSVVSVGFDEATQAPMVLLRDAEGTRELAIYIGLLEATAIAMQLEEVELARPMTHDLLCTTIAALGGSLERIEVDDLRDNTFYARLFIRRDGALVDVDSRPSDAIALALRTGAPIFVHHHVLMRAHGASATMPLVMLADGDDDAEHRWREYLESLRPEDFGKYKM